MKKLLSLLAACLLLAASLSAALAEAPDLSYVEENTNLYTITRNEETKEVTVASTMNLKDRAFTHQYSSDIFLSFTQFIVACNDDAAPALRLMISSWSELGYLAVESITFEFDGQTFIFEEVSDRNTWVFARPSYLEPMSIAFGEDNADFVAAFAEYCSSLTGNAAFDCTMTLACDGDLKVAVKMGEGFMQDFLLMKQAYDVITGAVTAPETAPVIRNEAPVADAETEPAAEKTDTYIVVDAAQAAVRNRAAIRLKPNLAADILAYAYTGETFRLMEELSDWYVIDVNGYTGYIHKGVARIAE